MDHLAEPLSPMSQSLDTSCFRLYVLGVMEFEVPVPHSHLMSSLKSILSFPPFTSILVRDESGVRRWETVEVQLEDHVVEPTISWDTMSKDVYAKCFSDYLSEIATPQLPHSKPLWEVHVINSSISTTLVLKVHHSIGDGYSLMGALLSCLQRADDPSLPVTFPSIKPPKLTLSDQRLSLRIIPSFVSNFFASIKDFGWSLLKSTVHEDDKTPIRSGQEGVEFHPTTLSNITIPIDHIRNIKSKLGLAANDVITGIVFYGIRLYMQDVDYTSRTKKCTLLPMLTTRDVQTYEKEKNMRMSERKGTWGNKFTYTHVSIPPLTDTHVFRSTSICLGSSSYYEDEDETLFGLLFSHFYSSTHEASIQGPRGSGKTLP